jgi:hypothetical protein
MLLRCLSLPVLATLILAGAGTAAAQSPPIIGTWKLTYAAGHRMENGALTEITGTGRLIVQLQGDSLIARLVPDPVGGGPARPETRMAARAGTGPVVFTHRGTARVNRNGEESEVTSISTWSLGAKGDTLEGTVERRIEGIDVPAGGPGSVSGTRVKP